MNKQYKVTHKSQYFMFAKEQSRIISAPNAEYIRRSWNSIMNSKEYKIVNIEEVNRKVY